MRIRSALPNFIAAIALLAAGGAAAKPQRIVSLNMCTDELVLRLARRENIASITWLSQNPQNANMADVARTIPANHGLVEEVLSYRPDLVVAGAYTTRSTVALLKRTGLPVREFGVPNNLDDLRAQIAAMAELLGEPERGQALIAAMDEKLAGLAATPQPVRRPRALVLRPNGVTVGRGSLVDQILTLAGFDNLAADLGIDNYGQISLETVALGQADILILDAAPDAPPSLAGEILHHPVLQRLSGRLKLVSLPSRLWTCGGPAVLDAIDLLRQAAQAPRAAAIQP